MGLITNKIKESSAELVRYKHAPRFASGGQSTQLIVGATPDSDYQIMSLSAALYKKYELKRVFYSAYIPVVENPLLPAKQRNRRFCASTDSIRRIGFCAITASMRTNCSMKSTRS